MGFLKEMEEKEKRLKYLINAVLNRFNLEIIKTHPKEAIKFAKDHFKNNSINAIEIGVLRGVNSEQILKNLNIKELYLIDPWQSYADYKKSEPERTQQSLNKDFIECKKRIFKYNQKVKYIKKLSEDAVKFVPIVDFIYIDGNHEYDYVKRDLELYWNKLNKGGIISGHDIQSLGVSTAVLEFARKNNLKINFGDRRDWWIIKK